MRSATLKQAVLLAALGALSLSALPAIGHHLGQESRRGVLTVLYDNYPFEARCETGWGFSALIEGVGRTILFDTGADGAALQRNADALKVSLSKADLVFISHDHGDHTGGLAAVLRAKPGLPVYVPHLAAPQFQSAVRGAGARLVAVSGPQTIAPGVSSTGDLGDAIREQALVLDSPQGLIVVTGCAHPGIVAIVERAKAVGKKDVWMVLGGFHLGGTSAADVERIIGRFKALGVQRVGPTHCTGDAAMAMFKKAFGQGFVDLGVGRRIEFAVR
jgi:7,8-dihydropterin-6-yl-methyl-4-(beta-D-ribofuranosyl)aminobenzene 5'-phosphate synthase